MPTRNRSAAHGLGPEPGSRRSPLSCRPGHADHRCHALRYTFQVVVSRRLKVEVLLYHRHSRLGCFGRAGPGVRLNSSGRHGASSRAGPGGGARPAPPTQIPLTDRCRRRGGRGSASGTGARSGRLRTLSLRLARRRRGRLGGAVGPGRLAAAWAGPGLPMRAPGINCRALHAGGL